jgi:peptidyl-prolyl cis-trans isomerase SurA
MHTRHTIRLIVILRGAARGWLAACLAVGCFAMASAQAPPAATPIVLDRVVAVVNRQAILASELDDEMQLAVLEPGGVVRGPETPLRALQRLISRALIRQQIREEDAQATEPSSAELDSRIAEIRKDLPACVRMNCTSDAGWKAFLASRNLTQERVRDYLRRRLSILHFIEIRFSQGIHISQDEIENYYKNSLLPQYPPGETVPPLEKVAPRIEEILLQQQVNVLFGDWLDNLRKQGEIEVLDPALEGAAQPVRRSARRGGTSP